MRNATHQEAVAALIANVSLIKLLVRHDPPPKGLQVRLTLFFLSYLTFVLLHGHTVVNGQTDSCNLSCVIFFFTLSLFRVCKYSSCSLKRGSPVQ